MKMAHDRAYANLLREILQKGEIRPDRTGTGTISLFGCRMEFDISESLPVLTGKEVLYDKVKGELLWIVSGSTDVEDLHKLGVHFWDENSSREFLDARGLTHYQPGDLGPVYGFQWRHWGAKYVDCKTDYTGQGIDQLQTIVQQLEKDKYSRRIILSAWNVEDLSAMALPPCHMMAQFYVRDDSYLDCMLFQRSGDMFLGVPFNIASYSTLTYMLAHLTDLKPGKFVHVLGDAHIYSNHVEAVNTYLERTPFEPPKLQFARSKEEIGTIDGFKKSDFQLLDYQHHKYIKSPMAV